MFQTFQTYLLKRSVKSALQDLTADSKEKTIKHIVELIDAHRPLSISTLNELKESLLRFEKTLDKRFVKEILHETIFSINAHIQKLLSQELIEEKLRSNTSVYDYDRFFENILNTDFRWYLAPGGFNNKSSLKPKTIKNMFAAVNKQLGKHFVYSGKKPLYFYELDYETKKVILLYHQITLKKILIDELKQIHKHNPSLTVPHVSLNEDTISTYELNQLQKILRKDTDILEKDLVDLRTEAANAPEDQQKKLLGKIEKRRESYEKRVNLISQTTNLLETYYSHFLQDSRWRIIDVISHLRGGRIMYFGEPAEGFWIWTITDEGSFHLGNRQDKLKGGYGTRLPHSTVAAGRRVLGAGEVELRRGSIIRFNAHSGHYYNSADIAKYNLDCKKMFLRTATILGITGPKTYVDEALCD